MLNAASAAPLYSNPGVENLQTYNFTAASTGDLIATFAGTAAAYEQQLGVLINGVSTGLVGLNNHTSGIGGSVNLGHVAAGDTLTFFDVITGGATWYSNSALNFDGGNHVYSRTVSAGEAFASSPTGTYVAFEDLTFPFSDFNYYDQTFVFTVTSAVPEPSTWAMMILGFFGVGFMMYRRRRAITASA
ncbi:MAG: PEPxxWA-CTERM sorting domain-containing protein [Bradyrhizobium sp.]